MLGKSEQLLRTIGQAIAKYRRAVGMTQAELAEKLDISNDAVSRMERGKSVPSVLRLLELSEIFHCEVADLITLSSNRSMDQARKLELLLIGLDGYERAELINIIERMLNWKQHRED